MRSMFNSKGDIARKSKLGNLGLKRLIFLGYSDNELICDMGWDLLI